MMTNPVSKFFIAALFVYLLMISSVWAQRILIDDPDQTVTVGNQYSCHQPVAVTVDTRTPDLYDADAGALQKLGDSVRAMLSYECPGLSAIRLNGLIRGLDDVVYQGEMTHAGNWLLQSQAPAAQPAPSPAPLARRYDDELKQGQLDVTGLVLGMSVAQAREQVTKTFGVEPDYDEANGLMSLDTGYCPVDLDAPAAAQAIRNGDKCLQAWFSDNRVARLERVTLLQAVDGRPQQVNAMLLDKYGTPVQSTSTAEASQIQLIWRAIDADSDERVIEEIDAAIMAPENGLVTTRVTLYATRPAETPDEHLAELDLKL